MFGNRMIFNLFVEVSHIKKIRTIKAQIGKIIGIYKHVGKVRKRFFLMQLAGSSRA